MGEERSKTIFVTGGSGYLGQFLVQALAQEDGSQQGYKVGLSHHSTRVVLPCAVKNLYVDLTSGDGLKEALAALSPVDVIINCAAVSQPALCERDLDFARALNVPERLLTALEAQREATGEEPLLIQLSTDQVYDGSKGWWREDDEPHPVNAYGRTKLEAERLIRQRWPRHVILRSSIIYGPQSPNPVSRGLFLQFIDSALSAGKPTTFFNDEFRCPIYVQDIVSVVRAVIEQGEQLKGQVLNMGGPERLSRVDMANQVAEVWGYDKSSILSVPSASVDRGVASPADISMDVSRLRAALLDAQLTPLREALGHMRPPSSQPVREPVVSAETPELAATHH